MPFSKRPLSSRVRHSLRRRSITQLPDGRVGDFDLQIRRTTALGCRLTDRPEVEVQSSPASPLKRESAAERPRLEGHPSRSELAVSLREGVVWSPHRDGALATLSVWGVGRLIGMTRCKREDAGTFRRLQYTRDSGDWDGKGVYSGRCSPRQSPLDTGLSFRATE